MSLDDVALAIVAKIPRAGACKTRLVPPLSPADAAALSRAFLRDTADNIDDVAGRFGATPVALYHGEPEPGELERTFGPRFKFLEQRGATFDERLANGATDLFAAGFCAVCLIDSDSPTVPARAFAEAIEVLRSGTAPIVIGEAEDGGYYLLGMRGLHLSLFWNITWSTSAVARETRERARDARLRVRDLVPWYDIDDAAGLERLAAEFAGEGASGYPAPATRSMLARLSIVARG